MITRKEITPRRSDVIKDYVRSLDDESWRFLQARLNQRLGGDLAEAISFMEKNLEVDRFLANASSVLDYYNRIDHIEAMIQGDSKRRATLPTTRR